MRVAEGPSSGRNTYDYRVMAWHFSTDPAVAQQVKTTSANGTDKRDKSRQKSKAGEIRVEEPPRFPVGTAVVSRVR